MNINGVHIKFARLYFKGGKTIAQIAADCDIQERTAYNWLRDPQIKMLIRSLIEDAALEASIVFGRAAEKVAESVVEIATKKDVMRDSEDNQITDDETDEPARVFRYGAGAARQAACDALQSIQINVKAAPEQEAPDFSELYKGYTHEDFARRAELLAERARKAKSRNGTA